MPVGYEDNVEAAQANTATAQQQQRAAQTEYDEANQAVNGPAPPPTAQDEYEQARSDAQANPTPENLAALDQKARDLQAAQDRLRRAINDLNTKNEALNNALAAEARAYIAARNAENAYAAESNTDGFSWSTGENHETTVGQNVWQMIGAMASLKVTGSSSKVTLGSSAAIFFGGKLTVTVAAKFTLFVGLEGKHQTGSVTTISAALKAEAVLGLKSSTTEATKNSLHIGPLGEVGPAEDKKHNWKEVLMGLRNAAIGIRKRINKTHVRTIAMSQQNVGELVEDISTLDLQIGKAKIEAGAVTSRFSEEKLTSTTFAIKAGGKLELQGQGGFEASGGGSTFKVTGSTELAKGGSKITCAGSGVSVNGKVLIN